MTWRLQGMQVRWELAWGSGAKVRTFGAAAPSQIKEGRDV